MFKNYLIKTYKSIDRLLCISDCSRFDNCNLVSLDQTNNICSYYFIDSIDQNQLVDSNGLSLYFTEPKYGLSIRLARLKQEFTFLTTNSSDIDKKMLTFYEFISLQRQEAKNVTVRGNVTQAAVLTSRRVYFSNQNWYSPFYMPFWPSLGEILYIEVDSRFSLTINKARTDLTNDLVAYNNSLFMFMNDLVKWNYIGYMNKTLFLTLFV